MSAKDPEETATETVKLARRITDRALTLMQVRDVKYGDAWREMRLSSLVDIAVAKFKRCTRLVDDVQGNRDKIRSDLEDMINYACFALIKLDEETIPLKPTEHTIDLLGCFKCGKTIVFGTVYYKLNGKVYHEECKPEETE